MIDRRRSQLFLGHHYVSPEDPAEMSFGEEYPKRLLGRDRRDVVWNLHFQTRKVLTVQMKRKKGT